MKLFYSDDYVASKHAFDTTRKSQLIARSLQHRPIEGIEIVAPRPVTVDQLLMVHTRDYVEAVRTGAPRKLAESQGFTWDEGLWTAVTASTGGMLEAGVWAAVHRENAGTLSSGLHHARANHGAGFCTFNGLALTARYLRSCGFRVLILDLDAHNGGGTNSFVEWYDNIEQIDISTNGYDAHDRSIVIRRNNGPGYMESIIRELEKVGHGKFDVCLYNSGMDPHEDCGIGGMDGIGDGSIYARENTVFAWAKSIGLPVAFAIAGGYSNKTLTRDRLTNLHRMTLEAAAN